MQYEKIDEIGNVVARQVEAILRGATSDLEALASSPVLIRPDSTREEVIAEFDRLVYNYDYLSGITLFDVDGTWVHSNAPKALGKAELRPEFKEYALEGKRYATTPEIPSYYRPGGKDPITLEMTLYVPVCETPTSPPVRVVSAKVSMSPIWEILDNAKVGRSGMFTLVDNLGVLLSDRTPEKAAVRTRLLKNKSTSFWNENPSGYYEPREGMGDYYYQTKSISPPHSGGDITKNWKLICAQSKEEIEEVISQTQFYQILVALITVIFAYAFGYGFSRKISMPLMNASQAAKLVASGDLETTVPEDGPNEIRTLAISFNQMVQELKGHRTHLESLVQSRTQRLRESQADLEDLTAQLRATYESTPEAIIVVRPTGEVLAANKRVRDFFGVNGARLLEEGLADGTPSKSALLKCFEDEEKFEEVWKQHTASSGLVHKGEWVVNGEAEMRLAIYSAPVMNSTGNTFARLWMFRDMTEQRRLEQGLQQSTKMEAIGRLSGGVAHDFNNLLTGIIGNLSLSELLGDMPKENEDLVLSAKRAAERAAGIVKQLLTFSRQNKVSLQPWSANRLVKDVQEILTPGLDPSIRLRVNLDDAEPFIFADGNQIDQVLMNFCVNARDALVGGGSITVTTAKAYVNLDALPRQTDCKPGDYVKISVQDDGTGMDESIREKIFEPFFTTKEQGKGTGLGLATSYGIVQEHHGWIECDSELGVGTTFSVYIPACDKPAEVAATASAPVVGGTETILIVDDEQIVRTVAENVLKRQGYKVETAQDGKEALEVVARCGKSISLIMLDLTMPRMSGRETFKELRSGRFPHIPVVICSGYLVEVDSFAEEAGSVPEGVVQKPYQVDVLAREIRRVIDGVDAKLV
ncbi:MAG: ATP-binding protein [Verrucomicrobiales bacterium]